MNRRLRAAQRLRRYLLRHGTGRFQVTVIVAVTGLAGFFTSFILFLLGVASMPIRYGAAVLVAYGAFLLLVRLWLSRQRRWLDTDVVDIVDPGLVVDVSEGIAADWPIDPAKPGGGGQFGGGGAGGNWDVDGAGVEAGSWVTEAATSSVETDEGAIVLLPLILVVGGLLALLSALYAAPLLLAEILVDVALVSGLYRRLHKLEPESWLSVAIRRTWMPVAIVLLCVVAVGHLLQAAFPTAQSIGDVLYLMQNEGS